MSLLSLTDDLYLVLTFVLTNVANQNALLIPAALFWVRVTDQQIVHLRQILHNVSICHISETHNLSQNLDFNISVQITTFLYILKKKVCTNVSLVAEMRIWRHC